MENSNVTPLVPKDKNTKEESSLVSSLSPREIVSELDRFVVGQKKAIKVASEICVFTNDNIKVLKI
jgi:ATP-dependent HslUV protease ATP-binding subunit HslU